MEHTEAMIKLKAREAELRCLGVQRVCLFGSAPRGGDQLKFRFRSVFDHERGKLGLFQLMDVKERIAEVLGCKIDIMTQRSLHPGGAGRHRPDQGLEVAGRVP